MDTNAEDQLDYEDEEYGGAQKMQYQGGGAIPALADDEMMGEDDDYDDLYSDVNVGESFLQVQRSEPPPVMPLGGGGAGNGGHQPLKVSLPQPKVEAGVSQGPNAPVVLPDGKYSNFAPQYPEQKVESSSGFQVPLPTLVKTEPGPTNMQANLGNEHAPFVNPGNGGPTGVQIQPQQANQMRINMNTNVSQQIVNENQIRPSADFGSTRVFVGELHWWTTDAEVETVLSQYGRVKEIKFFDEKASGKSKGYCQVDFFEPAAASECKERMNGYLFNGRACVVAFASPQTLKQMGDSYVNKNQVQSQIQPQGRRPMNDGAVGRGAGGAMNFQGGDGGRNFGRGGWGRGGQGMPNRPQGGGPPMRGRGGAFGGRGFAGNNGGGVNAGFAGPGFAGPAGAMNMMHPQGMNMMGVGFDPTYMGRGGGGYGGFPGSGFPGMIPSFPGVNAMGLAGVAPHVNPAFFNRGMAPNGMGMMGPTGMEGPHPGMWTDPNMSGWGGAGGEEQGQRTRESSYGGGEEGGGGGSDYGYGGGETASHEKVARSNTTTREKERGPEQPERRHRDDRENERDRENDRDRGDRDRDRDRERSSREHRYREERDGHRESRGRERDSTNDDDWDRGHSSRPRSRSRVVSEEDHHKSRSRDVDYGKRRRLPSE